MSISPFATEAWTEYALGICILFARILCRIRAVGMRWDGDDYFAVLAIILWTAELCMMHMIGTHGSIKGLTEQAALTLTEEEKHSIIIGAKCMIAGWCLYVSLIWALKACMLFLYGRLTLDLKQRQMVKITAVACAAAYISTITVILSHCTPIQRKWQIHPYPGDACALGTPMHYALLVTNVSTDFMIVAIPLPLLWKVRMPWHRKLLCGIWLCTGGFIIVAAILRCILCLLNNTKTNVSTIWSLRETFIGIIAANIPIIGPWITRAARNLPVVVNSGGGSKSSDAADLSGPLPGGHRLSLLERRAKENRIRRGMGWTTIQSGSHEHIGKDELELQVRSQSQSALSGITANGTGSYGLVQ